MQPEPCPWGCWRSLVPKRDSKNPGKWDPEGLEAFLVNARGRRAESSSGQLGSPPLPRSHPGALSPSAKPPERDVGFWRSRWSPGKAEAQPGPKAAKKRRVRSLPALGSPGPAALRRKYSKTSRKPREKERARGKLPSRLPCCWKKKKKKCPQIVARRRAPLSLGTRQETRNDEGKGTGSEVPLGHVALEGSRCRLR